MRTTTRVVPTILLLSLSTRANSGASGAPVGDHPFTLSPAGGGIFNFILLWINLPSRERNKKDNHKGCPYDSSFITFHQGKWMFRTAILVVDSHSFSSDIIWLV